MRQLESKTELLLDYDVPLDGVPVLDIRDNGDDYGYALIPFILKITNNSTNRKLSIEKMQASLLFPRDPQQLAVLEQAIVFLDNQPPFPIYLDTGEQQFIHCAIAWPVRREALSRFAEDNRDNLNSLTVSDYL
ncbi:MAG: hypothetical protein H8E40_04535, partial [Chloroflexi bacterium]|nr:hypothetical protein [Chloroflexota bacterium]